MAAIFAAILDDVTGPQQRPNPRRNRILFEMVVKSRHLRFESGLPNYSTMLKAVMG